MPYFRAILVLCTLIGAPCPALGQNASGMLSFDYAPLAGGAERRVDERHAFRLVDPGRMAISHEGPICDRSDGENVTISEDGVRTVVRQDEIDVPEFADKATVFLNGWSFRYLDGDHHLLEVGTQIHAIERDGTDLRWLAGGGMIDDGHDDRYEFCYVFSVVAWNSVEIEAVADHADTDGQFHNGATQGGNHTPLLNFRSYRQLPIADFDAPVALLSRGFDIRFGEDHHVLQFAYLRDPAARILEGGVEYGKLPAPIGDGDPSMASPNFASWVSSGILKDNDRARPFAMDEQISVLQGPDISSITPPFAIRPGRTPPDIVAEGCARPGGDGGIKRQEVVIRDLPFRYAVPVLSAWELSYGCDDEEISAIGIWLERIEFETQPDGLGMLSYTVASVLEDQDADPAHEQRHRVDIVGICRLGIDGETTQC